MWGHGRPRWLLAISVAALGLLCGDARGQFDALHPPRPSAVDPAHSLAPVALPDTAPPDRAQHDSFPGDSTQHGAMPRTTLSDAANGPLVGSPQSADEVAAIPFRNDAAINDLTLIDGQHGWAVGDAGVIWHTVDGGQHWQQQESGVACRLQSVQFVDIKNGWAAGGRTAPYTHLTTGVLLRTHDGGENWSIVDKLLLPALRRIQFVSAMRGCAIGQASDVYPCGVFFTDDGGRQWSPLPTADAADCIAGYLTDVGHGALALADGRLATVRDGRILPASCSSLGLASVRAMQFSGKRIGWLVGDGGLVMTTTDGGQTWQTPASEIPAEMRRGFEFSALAVRGSQVWIAGSPGNCLLHSPDGGRSWNVCETGQRLPIAAITFVDDLHGWCAGGLGTIEATDDGGRTWRRQRNGAERVALMGVFSEPSDVPLELFARESASDGYLSVVEVANRRDVEMRTKENGSLAERVQESLTSLGVQQVHVAWQFPLRQPGIDLSVAATTNIWDQAVDGNGLSELEFALVRRIRVWRPSVVVAADASEDAHGDACNAAEKLLHRAIVNAIRLAADPGFDKRTPPWAVERLFAAAPAGQAAGVMIHSSQLAPRTGQSLAEMTWQPRGLIFDHSILAPETLGFRGLENPLATGPATEGGDFFSGLGLRPGSEARRELVQPSLEAVTALRRAAQQRRNAQAILKRTSEGPTTPGWLTQINDLTAAMDPSSAGEILFQLGQTYARTGHWDTATQVFEMLVAQYPQHPLAPSAQIWLLQTYASSLAEHEAPLVAGDVAERETVPANVAANAVSSFTGAYRKTLGVEQPTAISAQTDGALGASPLVRQSNGANPTGSAPQAARAQRAIQLAGQIESTSPALYAAPRIRLPLAAAYRRLGMVREAEHALTSLRSGPHDAWWSCAEAENWLSLGQGPAPKSVCYCTVVGKRPRLDGTLDDPIWQHATTVDLRSALQDDTDWPATARLACDSQFLYLGVRCRQAPETDYQPTKTPRPRQADLSNHDRIELLLSPDRDYTSYYRLAIDHRGWVSSGCWNGAPWQPTCYVAAGARDGNWIVEAAIPWDQLTDRSPVGRRQPWAFNIQRTAPGVGFQSWSTPASVEVRPEGMGLLMFDPIAAVRGALGGRGDDARR